MSSFTNSYVTKGVLSCLLLLLLVCIMSEKRSCCIFSCGNKRRAVGNGFHYYGFPKNEEVKKKWCEWICAINGDDFKEQLTKKLFLCSDHFRQGDKGLKNLKPGSVPCIFNVVNLPVNIIEDADNNMMMETNSSEPLIVETTNDVMEVNRDNSLYIDDDFMEVSEEVVVCTEVTEVDNVMETSEEAVVSIETMDVVDVLELFEEAVCTDALCTDAVQVDSVFGVTKEFVVSSESFSVSDALEVPMEDVIEVTGYCVDQCEPFNSICDNVVIVENDQFSFGDVCEEICVTTESESDQVQNVPHKRIYRKCSVLGCESNNTTHSLFAFPRILKLGTGNGVFDEESLTRCKQWIKFCGNKIILLKDIASLHRYFHVCGRHFDKKDYYVTSRMVLKKGVVPSVFGPEPLSDVDLEIIAQGKTVLDDDLNGTADCHELSSYDIATRGCVDKLSVLTSVKNQKLAKKFEKVMESFEMKVCDVCNEKYIYYSGMKRAHRKSLGCSKFSSENNMDPGLVPAVLKDLSFVEEQLIARVHPVLSVYKLKGLQYGYRGNVINFFQDVNEFAKKLPHRLDDLNSVLRVKVNNSRSNPTDFRVRVNKVRDALLWLKENNPYYKEIEICEENLELLQEDYNVYDEVNTLAINLQADGKCSDVDEDEDEDIVHEDDPDQRVECSTVPEGTFFSQNQQVNSVLDWPDMHTEPVKESTPGFIVCAFPTLFPFGNCDLNDERRKEVKMHEYIKHLLCYKDDRFAHHKTFRFFAFNLWMRHTALSCGNVFVKKDSELSKMNVEQLKQRIVENPNVMRKIMFMGSNLRGSKSFWKSRSGELKDLVEQLGLPTIFLTMSAADCYWPDLFRLLTGKHISLISKSERRKLLQENPLIVDMFFQHRVECFLENVLEPGFGVIDYWYRIEYQHRGSPHLHGLFWLENAPDVTNLNDASDEEKKNITDYFDRLVSAVIPDKECVMPDQHPCEIQFGDVLDVKTDLSQLVKMVQQHKCSMAYCKRTDKKTKQTVCRFHFPKEIKEKSELIMNLEKNEFEFLPERNQENLNKFNPFIIGTWRANIDIAPVLSKKAVIEYLCKYISKSEVGSQTLKEICMNVCNVLDGSDKAVRAVHKILMKNCVERDISAQEVCHILMGSKLYSAGGRKFIIIHTTEKNWVPVESNSDDENESNINGKNFVDKYLLRPTHLHALSMFNIAKYYNVSNWSKCKKFNIVRVFPRLVLGDCEESNEAFYRQQVMLHVPFREEKELKNGEETWKNVYEKHGVKDLRVSVLDAVNLHQSVPDENIHNEEDTFIDRSEDWMIASKLNTSRYTDPVQLGRREVDVEFDWHYNDNKYASYGGIPVLKNFINDEKKKDNDCFIWKDMPEVEFSEEQKSVKELMEKQINALETGNLESIPKRVLVQGKAGTGKSLLIHYLVDILCRKYGSSSFLLLGPTGVSAINIGGTTLHSGLHLPRKRQDYKELCGDTSRNFCNKMEIVKFVIIDEYSMIGTNLLAMVDKRLREGTGVNEPFGNLFVYVFGDYKQLPPVRDDCLFGGPIRGDLSRHGRNMFETFEKYFVLGQVFRQKDQRFLDLLDRLSHAEINQEDYQILKTRFINNVSYETEKKFENAIRIMSTKKKVKDYNYFKQLTLQDSNGNFVPVASIPAKHHGDGAEHGTVDEADGLQPEIHLGVGTRIMLRTNIWVRKGLVNGALGVVKDLLYEDGAQSPNDPPANVMIKFDGYSGPGIGSDNLVPIIPCVRSWTKRGSSTSCSRQQFPIVVSYACTIHKSQGLTLEQAVVDVGDDEFSLGITYVGISRVKSLDGLLLQPVVGDRFYHIKNRVEMSYRRNFEQNVLCV